MGDLILQTLNPTTNYQGLGVIDLADDCYPLPRYSVALMYSLSIHFD